MSGNNPRTFYDPFDTDQEVEMVNRLVLTVRMNDEGTIYMKNMWISPEQAHPLFGGEDALFKRIKTGEPTP